MSESIGMKIEIGGTLPASLIKEFLKELNYDLGDITGPTTEKELRSEAKGKTTISWNAVTNYGECNSLKAFCRKHKLGYVHTCEAKYEYNGEIKYWVPGMKNEIIQSADQNGDVVVHLDQVKPLVNLLLGYAKHPFKALPLFINEENEDVKELIELGLKYPKKFLPALEKKLGEFFPTIPELTPFIIKE